MAMDGVAGGSPWHASTTNLCVLPDQAAGDRSADRRLRRFAWLGVLSLAALVAYLWGSWRLLDVTDEARPVFVLTGWGVLRDTIRLHGRAQMIFQVAVAALGAAIVVAAGTGGFRAGRVWGRLGSLAVGVAGLLAAVPLGVAAVVVAVNAIAWLVATLIVMLIGLALLVRLALGGRR
jgi:hypothetical protein